MPKVCSKCGIQKPPIDFVKNKKSGDGLDSWCKLCYKKQNAAYHKTKIGLVSRIYGNQKRASKIRCHPEPSYGREQLQRWLFRQPKFHVLYKAWVEAGYDTKLVPSPDRVNDYKPYTLDNLTIVTWQENKDRSCSDRKNGTNNKGNKAVKQFTRGGVFVNKYHSMIEASRQTGVHFCDISRCCLGIRKTAGDHKWRTDG